MNLTDRSCCALAGPGLTLAGEPDAPAGLIVGLGNCLLMDDGIGVHAIWRLMDQPPARTLVLEVGTDVFSCVPWLERTPRVLAIDAMDAGGAPGTIYHCAARDVRLETAPTSLHELGLLAMLEFVPRPKWPEISILGIQPAAIHYGLDLSPVLEQVLPKVVQAAREIARSWSLVKAS
jgi:hydrogenase maturation protease